MEIDFLDLQKKNQSKPCYKHSELVNTMVPTKSQAIRDHGVTDTTLVVEGVTITHFTEHPRRILGSRFNFKAGFS